MEVVKAKRQTYYEQNKEHIRAYYKAWYQSYKNKDALKERCRVNYAKWRAEHPEATSKYNKEYYQNNAEHYRQYRMNRYLGNKEAINRRVKELRQANESDSFASRRSDARSLTSAPRMQMNWFSA